MQGAIAQHRLHHADTEICTMQTVENADESKCGGNSNPNSAPAGVEGSGMLHRPLAKSRCQEQTEFCGGGGGNVIQACIATILSIKLDQTPKFSADPDRCF